MVDVAVSGRHSTKDLPAPEHWSLDLKIEIFAARVKDWGLDIAHKLRSEQHGGYARLSIVLSYFEMIGVWMEVEGYKRKKKYKYYFDKGVESVGNFAEWPDKDVERLKKRLWSALRCGLYHLGMSRQGMWVYEDLPKVYVFESKDDLIIAPNALVHLLSRHFDNYLGKLRKANVEYIKTGNKPDLLEYFQKSFDKEITNKVRQRLARRKNKTQ